MGMGRWDKGVSFLHGPGTKGKMRIISGYVMRSRCRHCTRAPKSVWEPEGQYWESPWEHKQAAQQRSKLHTATEKSQLPKVGPLPGPGIHMLLACLCGQLEPCEGLRKGSAWNVCRRQCDQGPPGTYGKEEADLVGAQLRGIRGAQSMLFVPGPQDKDLLPSPTSLEEMAPSNRKSA